MKVIHVPFCFRPDPMGGTEVYVEGLAREQQGRGLEVVVAAPGGESEEYVDAGLRVRRFGVSVDADLNSLYGDGDRHASAEFARIVDHEQPDVVHLHAFTSAVSVRLANEMKRRGVRLVFTYHTPTVSCQRGTLLRWGRDVCDGKLNVRTCAACTLHGLGVARTPALVLGALPTASGDVVGRLGLTGGAWTGLRMSALVDAQHAAFRSFIHSMDQVVVLCDWARELLVRNGISPHRLILSRHGLVDANRVDVSPRPAAIRDDVLRIVFLGRLHPTKGVDLLLRAMARLKDARLQLDVFGIVENGSETPYWRSLRALADGDPRITFRAPIASNRIQLVLQNYDVLAVPSRWLETGPLVVLEAFAAGIPVVGSRLGGIAELVSDGVDGLLVDPESVAALASALGELSAHPDLLARLRRGVRPPRRMAAVADDMFSAYRQLVPAT